MPNGRVRWFDAARGYGFITSDDGKDVFMPASSLPAGVSTVRKGTKVEFSVADGRQGPQALDVSFIGPTPSVIKATRPKPDDMAAIVEDLINLLDKAGNGLRHRHYPSNQEAKKLAVLLRAVADDFDVQE